MQSKSYVFYNPILQSWMKTAPKLTIADIGHCMWFAWGRLQSTTHKIAPNDSPLCFDWFFTQQDVTWEPCRNIPFMDWPDDLAIIQTKRKRLWLYDESIAAYRTTYHDIILVPIQTLTKEDVRKQDKGEFYMDFINPQQK